MSFILSAALWSLVKPFDALELRPEFPLFVSFSLFFLTYYLIWSLRFVVVVVAFAKSRTAPHKCLTVVCCVCFFFVLFLLLLFFVSTPVNTYEKGSLAVLNACVKLLQ